MPLRPLNRRTFLKAAGVSLALPWLDAMRPAAAFAAEPGVAAAAAASAEPPRRFVAIMTNQGILPQFFFPQKPGKEYEPTPYLDLLKDHRADMTVFSGVSLPGVDGGHAAEMCFLTGAPGASRGTFKNSISLDQFMAERVGSATRFPSLSLMVGKDNASLSWTRNGSMIPAVSSPLKLYNQMFVEDTPQARAAALNRLKEDRSLLDGLMGEVRRLERDLGPGDRTRMDQYLTSVRELEQRLAKAESWVNVAKPKPGTPAPAEIANHDDLPKNLRVMLDLVRLALETDSARIVTVCISLASVTPSTIPGVKSNTHGLTHHGNRPDVIAELRKIEEAEFAELATFLSGLRGSTERGASLLDRTAVVYGTNMGSANAHSNDNLPVLLAGGGFRHGQHLAFDRKNNYPLSNLYVSLLQRMGMEVGRFSSGQTTMRGLEMA
jgi:hypothetical protein